MRRVLLSIAFAGMLPFSAAQADVSGDLTSNLSAVDVLSNALNHCISSEAPSTCSVAEIEKLMLDVAAVDVELLDGFVTAGIESGLDAKTVVEAAIKAGANPELVAQTAILAGADPTDVAEATAAGPIGQGQGQGQGLNIAPGQTGNAVTPAPFGNNAGGGGGGNTSPT